MEHLREINWRPFNNFECFSTLFFELQSSVSLVRCTCMIVFLETGDINIVDCLSFGNRGLPELQLLGYWEL